MKSAQKRKSVAEIAQKRQFVAINKKEVAQKRQFVAINKKEVAQKRKSVAAK